MQSDSQDHASEFRRSLSEATQRVESIIDEAEATAEKIRADAKSEADSYREQRMREVDAELGVRSSQVEELARPLAERIEGLREQAQQLSTALDSTLARLRELSSGQRVDIAGARSGESAIVPPTAQVNLGGASNGPSVEEQIYGRPIATEAAASGAGEPESSGDVPEEASYPPGGHGPAPVSYPGTAETTGEAADPVERGNALLAGGDAPAGADPASEDVLLRATQLAVSGSSRHEIEAALRSEFDLEDVGSVLDGILGPEEA